MSVFLENFVSYLTPKVTRNYTLNELYLVENQLTKTTTVTNKTNLHSRLMLLRLRAILIKADSDYEHKYLQEALTGYEKAAQFILELIGSNIKKFHRPKIWPNEKRLGNKLVEASINLLTNLTPEPFTPPFLFTSKLLDFKADELKADTRATIEAYQPISSEILMNFDLATTAIEQGDWIKATKLYTTCLEKITGNSTIEKELKATIMMNLGAVEIQRNRTENALKHLLPAKRLFKIMDDKLGIAETLHNIGIAYLRKGNKKKSIENLKEARNIAGKVSLKGYMDGEYSDREIPLTTPITNLQPNMSPRFTIQPTVTHSLLPLDFSIKSQDIIHYIDMIGSHDLSLKFRSIRKGVISHSMILETSSQSKHENYNRILTLMGGDKPIKLSWQKGTGIPEDTLINKIYLKRVNAKKTKNIGLQAKTLAELAANLSHLYHLILPVRMGDCYHQLGEYEEAQIEYRRAIEYKFINKTLEIPDLWRRLAQNILSWGDFLYRGGKTSHALPIYKLIMDEKGIATTSFLYVDTNLKTTGISVKNWLKAIKENTEIPIMNPALTHILHTIRLRWTYIKAGLDFYGNIATIVSPFTFKYLYEVARYFGNRAIQTEQRYIEFYTRFENGQMTRKELENAYELSKKETDAAKQREQASKAADEMATASVTLANLRHSNAQNLLSEFNSVAWEMECLAGHIARGNAFTGGELPNLHYSAGGGNIYDFSGKKHEVLQDMTMRQTEISNDLQRIRMQNTISELNAAKDIADAQRKVTIARYEAAKIETEIAEEREKYAKDMHDAYNNRLFNPEQWLHMAYTMKILAENALYRGIQVAKLMEQAYNFENFDNRKKIRDSYNLSITHNLLGGEKLVSDIESFLHYHVTQVRQKPIPIKWAISLAEEFPGQFYVQFPNTGVIEFDIDLERVSLAFPGTYRHILMGAELEIDGFLPPGGLAGRLTNSGLGRYRDRVGNCKFRLQPSETIVLSRFDRRKDYVILAPPQEMRNLFEGSSTASGWLLEIPTISNDVNLRAIFDIRLVLYFECLFDNNLFSNDSSPHVGVQLERTRAIHLRYNFPDVFYTLKEHGKAILELTPDDFPFNHEKPQLKSLALAFVPEPSSVVAGTELLVKYPGQTTPIVATISSKNIVQKSVFAASGNNTALGIYEIEIKSHHIDKKENISDIILVMDYRFTPRQ